MFQGDPPALGHDRVEGVDRLRVVHPVEEPELPLLELAARLAEEVVVGIEALPVLGARRRLDLERAQEALRRLCRCHAGDDISNISELYNTPSRSSSSSWASSRPSHSPHTS